MSVSIEDAVETMVAHLEAGWIASFGSSVPLYKDNVTVRSLPTRYGIVSVEHDPGSQRTLGPPTARTYDRRGRIKVKIVTDSNLGVRAGYEMSTVVRNILEGQDVGNRIIVYNVDVRESPGNEATRRQILCEGSFWYEEVR